MRIVSWNVNGLRTLKGYQPWYSHKNFAQSLQYLQADIACFQECKLTRKTLLNEPSLGTSVCMVDGYQAFYNLHPEKGYSGTSVWTRNEACMPVKAEEGITGRYAREGGPGGSITAGLGGSIASSGLKEVDRIGAYPVDIKDELDIQLWKGIDNEGRGVVLDCGMFVLFNLYCPNETGPERLPYKMAYYKCLEERVQRLVREGREVIIVGDINICRDEIDHPDPKKSMEENELSSFKAHPARQWLDQFLEPNGTFIDVGRHLHPNRLKMYTCWNTVIDARPVNYGARLDYTIITPGLMQWVKGADIQPDIFGSDHCPVYLDLHDELEIDGKTVYIKDLLNGGKSSVKAPPLACSNWPEFSAKQRKLASYFIAPKSKAAPVTTAKTADEPTEKPTTKKSPPVEEAHVPTTGSALADALFDLTANTVDYEAERAESLRVLAHPSQSQNSKANQPASVTPSETSLGKRKAEEELPSLSQKTSNGHSAKAQAKSQVAPSKKGNGTIGNKKGSVKSSAGQLKLSSFFSGPKTAPVAIDVDEEPNAGDEIEAAQDADRDAALRCEQQMLAESSAAVNKEEDENATMSKYTAAMAWGKIFTPPTAPLCSLHQEPAKAWTVNKSGPNHGRKFWLCNRPVGPGHEGSGVPKDKVNPEYRCDFFLWESDRQKMQTRSKRTSTESTSASPPKAFGEVGRLQREKELERKKNEEPRPHKKVKP